MCFKVKHKSKIKIATKDIKCAKVFREHDDKTLWSFNNWSDHPSIEYKQGVPAGKVRLFIYENEIEAGYHSCKDAVKAKDYIDEYGWHRGVIKICVIPKGSRYCENDTQYVSETIILID